MNIAIANILVASEDRSMADDSSEYYIPRPLKSLKLALRTIMGIIPFLFCLNAYASENPCFQSGAATSSTIGVYYVNGILNNPWDAQYNAAVLKLGLEEQLDIEIFTENLFVCNKYNPAGFSDFLEVLSQFSEQLFGNNLLRFFDFLNLDFFGLNNSVQSSVKSIVLDFLVRDAVDETVDDHVNEYRRELLSKGGKLLLVGHSQGNFFANDTYEELSNEERRRTRVVAIATPARKTAGEKSGEKNYVTDLDDIITLVPLSRPGNVDNNVRNDDGFLLDSLRHSFAGHYMRNGTRSKRKILNLIEGKLFELGFFDRDTVSDAQYLTFLEGNPNVPGDGRVLGSGNPGLQGFYDVEGMIDFSNRENGIAVTAFYLDFTRIGTIGFRFRGFPLSCNVGRSQAPDDMIEVNGVIGRVVRLTETDLQSLVRVAKLNGCPDEVSIDEMYLSHLAVVTPLTLDALAIGTGSEDVPNENTPNP